MKQKVIWAMAAMAMVVLNACTAEAPKVETGYTLELKAGVFAGKTSAVALQRAYAVVNEVELERESDTADFEIDVQGEYTFDLLTGLSTPAFPIALIPSGIYEELEIELEQEGNDTTVYVEATFTDSIGAVWPVILTVTESIELEIEDELNGIAIDSNAVSNLAVYWDVEGLLNAANLETAQKVNGIIYLDEDHNEGRYEAIVEALNVEIEIDDND